MSEQKLTEISPIKWAEKIGKRPQLVYGWIRNNGMPSHTGENGKAALYEEEADAWYNQHQAAPRKSSPHEEGESAPRQVLPLKSITRHERLPKTGLQAISQVDRALENLILLKKSNGRDFPFTAEDLRRRLKKGDIIVEDPENVLWFVIEEYIERGRTDIADALTTVSNQFNLNKVPRQLDGKELLVNR